MDGAKTALGEIALLDLLDRGEFVSVNGKPFYNHLQPVHGLPRGCDAFDKDTEHAEAVLAALDIYPLSSAFRRVVEVAREHCRHNATKATARDVSHYDEAKNVFYMHDGLSHMYRVRPDSSERVKNGTDGVFFVRESGFEEWQLHPEH